MKIYEIHYHETPRGTPCPPSSQAVDEAVDEEWDMYAEGKKRLIVGAPDMFQAIRKVEVQAQGEVYNITASLVGELL